LIAYNSIKNHRTIKEIFKAKTLLKWCHANRLNVKIV